MITSLLQSMNNNDDPNDINSIAVRYAIREAVEREMSIQLATIRDRMLIFEGTVKSFNQELQSLTDTVRDLDEVVRGDERQGIRGLIKTVGDVQETIKELIGRFDAADKKSQKLIHYAEAARWLTGVLILLGVLNNPKVVDLINFLLSLLH